MLNCSFALNREFDKDLQDRNEKSFGAENFFDVVSYYYSYSKKINYTTLFLRGKEIVSSESVQILTRSFKLKGIYTVTDDVSIKFEFYASGEKLFSYQCTHPHELKLEGNFEVSREGDINQLTQFGENVSVQEIEKVIHGDGLYFFFPKAQGSKVFTLLGLSDLKPMLFWDYDSLVEFEKKVGLDYLVKQQEFENLQKVEIIPSY